MVVVRRTEGGADLWFANDELVMLNNALNEMCNGLDMLDTAFQTRVGWDRDALRDLLAQINSII